MDEEERKTLMDFDPKVHVAFKYLLSDPKIRLAIINDIFEARKIPAVTEVTPLPGELTPKKIKERGAILYFLATDNSGRSINLEMQRLDHGNFIYKTSQ